LIDARQFGQLKFMPVAPILGSIHLYGRSVRDQDIVAEKSFFFQSIRDEARIRDLCAIGPHEWSAGLRIVTNPQ
jgi:hypothetical protein